MLGGILHLMLFVTKHSLNLRFRKTSAGPLRKMPNGRERERVLNSKEDSVRQFSLHMAENVDWKTIASVIYKYIRLKKRVSNSKEYPTLQRNTKDGKCPFKSVLNWKEDSAPGEYFGRFRPGFQFLPKNSQCSVSRIGRGRAERKGVTVDWKGEGS